MAIYIISRDVFRDGSGLIIRSTFNCILLHDNDVSKLALCLCKCGQRTLVDIRHPLSVTPADLETGTLGCFFFATLGL